MTGYGPTYAGIRPWVFTGAENYVAYDFACRGPDGSYTCLTRIEPLPANYGVDQLLHAPEADEPQSSDSSEAEGGESESSLEFSSLSDGDSDGFSDGEGGEGTVPADSVTIDLVVDVICEGNSIVVCTRPFTFPHDVDIGALDCGESSEEHSESSEVDEQPSSGSSDAVSDSSSHGDSSGSASSGSESSESSQILVAVAVGADPSPVAVLGPYTQGSETGGQTNYSNGVWFLWYDDLEDQYVLSLSLSAGQEPGDAWWEGELGTQPRGTYNPAGNAISGIAVE